MTTADFLTALPARIEALQAIVRTEFRPLPAAVLNRKPGPEAWSILECLEHLNRYSRYYHPALHRALSRSTLPRPEFSFSWLGRKSIEAVRPANTKRQKTLARMNPNHSQLTPATLDEFEARQQELLALVARAATTDLTRRAVPVEFLRLLRLSIGDTLEFLLAHQERHLGQAQRARCQTPAVALPPC